MKIRLNKNMTFPIDGRMWTLSRGQEIDFIPRTGTQQAFLQQALHYGDVTEITETGPKRGRPPKPKTPGGFSPVIRGNDGFSRD